MSNGSRRNVFVVAAVILLAVAVIVGVCLLIFGEYLIPLMLDTAPYSYLTVVVVVLGLFFFFAL